MQYPGKDNSFSQKMDSMDLKEDTSSTKTMPSETKTSSKPSPRQRSKSHLDKTASKSTTLDTQSTVSTEWKMLANCLSTLSAVTQSISHLRTQMPRDETSKRYEVNSKVAIRQLALRVLNRVQPRLGQDREEAQQIRQLRKTAHRIVTAFPSKFIPAPSLVDTLERAAKLDNKGAKAVYVATALTALYGNNLPDDTARTLCACALCARVDSNAMA